MTHGEHQSCGVVSGNLYPALERGAQLRGLPAGDLGRSGVGLSCQCYAAEAETYVSSPSDQKVVGFKIVLRSQVMAT